jgi:hypothetical protein
VCRTGLPAAAIAERNHDRSVHDDGDFTAGGRIERIAGQTNVVGRLECFDHRAAKPFVAACEQESHV